MIGKDGYYSFSNLLSYDPYLFTFIVIIGGRGIGKTTSAQSLGIKKALYSKDDEFSWIRTTPKAIAECMDSFPEPVVREKIKSSLEASRKKLRINGKIKGHFFALSQAHNIKGKSVNWRNQRFVFFDEFNQEPTERKNFDIVDAFLSAVETITRLGSTRIKVMEEGEYVKPVQIIFMGNDTQEVGPVLERFGFVPNKPGRYVLPKKRLIVEYVEDSEDWKRIRQKSPLAVLRKKSDRTLGDIGKERDTKIDVTNFGSLENPRFFCRLWYSLNEAVTVFTHSKGLFITNQFDSKQALRLAGLSYKVFVVKTKDIRAGRIYNKGIVESLQLHIQLGRVKFNNAMIGRLVIQALATN